MDKDVRDFGRMILSKKTVTSKVVDYGTGDEYTQPEMLDQVDQVVGHFSRLIKDAFNSQIARTETYDDSNLSDCIAIRFILMAGNPKAESAPYPWYNTMDGFCKSLMSFETKTGFKFSALEIVGQKQLSVSFHIKLSEAKKRYGSKGK